MTKKKKETLNGINIDDEFKSSYSDHVKTNQRPTILICGYTGAGKSSMLRALLGDVVSEEKIGHGRPMTSNFDIYQNDYLSVYDSKGFEPGQTEQEFIENVDSFVKKCREDSNVQNHIHLVWYCIQGAGARVTEADKRLIQNVFNKNVLVLVTKNDITRDKQRTAIKEQLIAAEVPETKIIFCSEDDEHSKKKIIQTSFEMMPEAFRDAFIAGQVADLDRKDTKANTIIHTASLAAGGVGGGNPFPGSDAALITPIQVGMIGSLAYLYGVPKEEALVLLGPAMAQGLGIMTASSLAKLIPGFGQVAQAVVAATITEALGFFTKSFLYDCATKRVRGEELPKFHVDPKIFTHAMSKIKKAA